MGNGPIMAGRNRTALVLSHVSAFLGLFLASMWLRVVVLRPDPALQGYLQVTTGLLALIFAALALVRFQGTQDRSSLILAAGFLWSGMILAASSLLFFKFSQVISVDMRWLPLSWWVSRIALALLLVAALIVEHFLPRSRHPLGEIAGALLAVVGATYLITAALRRLPAEVSRHPGALIPSPQQLLPAGIFLVALLCYRRRLQVEDSAFDRAVYAAIWMNLGAQLAASQSERLLDSPFMLAQTLTVTSYATALGGALLDNSRLFEKVRHLAVSDPLTGLANYRRFLDVLESEMERSNRSARPFAVLLLDLDGLKKINDTYGHLVGNRALCRMADILRIQCRAIDTAARYAGDEFALILPETEEVEARRVANRIRNVMASDTETPPLSVSIGISIFLGNGERIDRLLSEADQQLYAEKARRAQHSVTTVDANLGPQKG